MGAISRTAAFVVMSVALWFLTALPAGVLIEQVARANGARLGVGVTPAVLTPLLAAAVGAAAFTAPTSRRAWTRLFAVASVAAFLLPIEALVAGFAGAAETGGSAGAGAAAGLVMAILLGVVGLFLGLAFAAAARFARD